MDYMEKKGVHFFGVHRMKGEEKWKFGFVFWLENLRSNYPTVVCFRFFLGPVLVDS
jgi:hypothetical protein